MSLRLERLAEADKSERQGEEDEVKTDEYEVHGCTTSRAREVELGRARIACKRRARRRAQAGASRSERSRSCARCSYRRETGPASRL